MLEYQYAAILVMTALFHGRFLAAMSRNLSRLSQVAFGRWRAVWRKWGCTLVIDVDVCWSDATLIKSVENATGVALLLVCE